MEKQYVITVESEDNLVRKLLLLSANVEAEVLRMTCCRAERNGKHETPFASENSHVKWY